MMTHWLARASAVRPTLRLLWLLTLSLSANLSHAQVVADFTVSDTVGCGSLPVNFNAAPSQGSNLTFQWLFGNGNSSSSAIAFANYTNPGTYQVQLVVQDTIGGDRDTAFQTIVVHPLPTTGFTLTPTAGCAPLTVSASYSGNSNGFAITNYSWDFGDGTVLTGANPSHTYTAPGTYDVTLLLIDVNGCQRDSTQLDVVSISEPPQVAVDFTLPNSCALPFAVDFTATPAQAGTFTYAWDFGDGGTSTQQNPTHGYTTPGTYDVELTITDSSGCSNVILLDDAIQLAIPQANFGILDTVVCVGESLSIFDLSTGASTYSWNFGAGSVVTGPAPTFAYPDTGLYTVTLIVGNAANCRDTLTRQAYVEVQPGPTAAFTSSDPSSCLRPYPVDFLHASQNATSFFWDFGDGSSSTAPNPSHVYQDSGFYEVTLAVTSANGCTDTLRQPNYVQIVPPNALFTVQPREGCVPLDAVFADASSSPFDSIVSWNWTFGDGGASNLQNPTHSYGAGQFIATLQVTTAQGCTDTAQRIVSAGTQPLVNFDATPRVVCANQPVNFQDLSNVGTEWFWYFGDGSTSTDQNPIYTYGDTGYFDVTLIVSNYGCTDTLLIPDFIYVRPPIADFLPLPGFGCEVPLTVNFNNISIGADTYFWQFGDGTTDTVQFPVHTFDSLGTYPVTLTVTNDSTGCSDDIAIDLPIANPTAAFTALSTSGCTGTSIDFVNHSTGANGYLWIFGDGDSATAVNPSHQYNSPGQYDVTLIAYGPGGCEDTVQQATLVEIVGPETDFTASQTTGCAPLFVTFTDNSSANAGIAGYSWDFGDGNTSLSQNPTHQYLTPGQYDVTLVVIDNQGCTDTLRRPSFIEPTFPNADFTTEDTLTCAGAPVQFTNLSTGVGNTYLWDFGDGTTSTVPNPVKIFPGNSGSFTITLVVTDVNGCQSSISRSNYISVGPPVAQFAAAPVTQTCPPLTVNFTNQSSANVSSWQWDFGDGSTSSAPNPSKIYNLPGQYDVTLVVTSSQGCADTLTMPGLVDLSGPSGSFSASVLSGCSPLKVVFTAQTQGAVQWVWDFGDGNGGFGQIDSNVYVTDTIAVPSLIITDAQGCTRTLTSPDSIVVRPGPEAAFTPLPDSVCPGQTVSFTNQTNSPIFVGDYLWQFGDAANSTANTTGASFAYGQPGQYQVRLIATAQNGCVDTAQRLVTVLTPPDAAFVPDDDSVCLGVPISFSDSSSAGSQPLDTWQWRFAPGQTSAQQSPSHLYASTGSQSVQLVVTDEAGCTDTALRNVQVLPRPTADFAVSATNGCAPRAIQFTDQSVGVGANGSYFWDFGDGGTSTQASPLHSYQQDGDYDVSLTVTNQFGCANALLMPDLISLSRPTGSFTSNATPACPPFPVDFVATASSDTSISSYLWDFGNGDTAIGASPSYVYQQGGDYDVTPIVVDAFGCRDTVRDSQHVQVLTPPTADFGLSASEVCAPATVSVSDSSQAGSAAISFREYDFANGNTSSALNASAQYLTAGTYALQLIVADANGCADTAIRPVLVHPQAQANFAASDSNGCANVAISFTDLSDQTPPVTSWLWYFGDGDSSTLQNPTHLYDSTGSFPVTLQIVDQNGCRDSLTQPGFVSLDGPSADFTPANQSICPGTTASFSDASTSVDPIVGWLWDFGDGTTDTVANPSHVFTQPGLYTVTLTVTDADGCQQSRVITDAVEVWPQPDAAFVADTSEGCAPLTVSFSDASSSPNGSISSYLYDFANGSTSIFPNPARTFLNAGSYAVALTVTDNLGCTATDTLPILVRPTPTAAFVSDLSGTCANQSITFLSQSTGLGANGSLFWDFGDGGVGSGLSPSHSYSTNGSYDVTLVAVNDQGCADTLVAPAAIQIGPPPVNFMVMDSAACPGTTFDFADASQPQVPFVSWAWDFGDGTSGTGSSASHMYAASGSYDVTLTVTDSLGCVGSLTQPALATVWTAPTAAIAVSDSQGCPPLAVQLFSQSSGNGAPIVSQAWNLGNGQVSSQPSPSTVYQTPGTTFQPQLIVVDARGCRDTVSRAVSTFDPPVAQLLVPQAPGCVGAPVSFADFSASGVGLSDWLWTFGDGQSSTQQNPSHVYDSAGTYPVRLTVSDLNGCIDSADLGSVVRIWQPEAAFTQDGPICPLEAVNFTDQSTGDTTLTAWQWDFGSVGATSTQPNPSHSYAQPGFYDVQLIVTDAIGCRDTLEQAQAVEVHQRPNAELTLSPEAGCAPLLVQASDASTGPAPMSQQFWALNGQATGNGPSAQFPNLPPGEQVITLRVIDGHGCRDTTQDTVTVFAPPQVDFTANDTIVCAHEIVRFFDQTSPSGVAWQWRFGDGTGDSVQNPVHVYANDGDYDVSLIATDVNGCTDSLTKVEYIQIGRPDATFTAEVPAVCPPVEATFLAEASSPYEPLTYAWTFGDGTPGSSQQNPSHVYADTGSYVVTLTVVDQQGCERVLRDTVRVDGEERPAPINIHAASVENGETVALNWSRSTVPNFGSYLLYWQNAAGSWELIHQSNSRSDSSYVDSRPGTLLPEQAAQCYKITQRNACGNETLLDQAEAHCTVELRAEALPDRIALAWTPYQGWATVDRYEIYRVDDYQPGSAEFMDVVAGNRSTWVDSSTACFNRYSYRVQAFGTNGLQVAWSDTASAVNEKTEPEASAYLVRATVEDNRYVRVEWEDFPVRDLVEASLERSIDQGATWQPLAVLSPTQLTYADSSTDVQTRSYHYRLLARDSCGFTTPYSNLGTSILLTVAAEGFANRLDWTAYQGWPNGVDRYEVQLQRDGGWVTIHEADANSFSYLHPLTAAGELVSGQYCYRIVAFERGNRRAESVSNHGCTGINPVIHVPNAFTPNGDGINERFYLQGDFIESLELRVFNRWGEEIFVGQGYGPGQGWDGTRDGVAVQEGVYVFRYVAQLANGQTAEGSGSVSLIR